MCIFMRGGIEQYTNTIIYRMLFKEEAKYQKGLEEGKVTAKWRIQ